MRSEKHKLSQPPRLKSMPRFVLSGDKPHSDASQRFDTEQQEPFFLTKNKPTFDEASFQAKYERALQLISVNRQQQSRSALSILQFLSAEIPRLPKENGLGYELLENIVINCWRLKNSFKDESHKQESLAFIRNYVNYFAETYKREQVHKNNLHLLYLIQANEEFDEKLYADALKSCQLSIKHCSSVKNQAHLLKVEYLKCSIHNALGNHREEAQAIKRSLFFINSIIAITTDESQREYVSQLKKNLLSRQTFLKDNPNHQKSVDMKKTSFSLFRKRSLSHKRQGSQKEIPTFAVVQQKKTEQSQIKGSKRPLMKSIHARSANISKYHPSTKEERTTFLPVDLTKFNKTDQKLKKKPLKITERHRVNDFQESRTKVMDQIEELPPITFNYQSLMVRRPNQARKQSVKKQTKPVDEQSDQPSEQVPLQEVISKKESNRGDPQQKIQPVTHYIAKTMLSNDEVVEQQQEQLVRECVKLSQQAFLRTFLRKLVTQQQNPLVQKASVNISNHPSRIDSSRSSDYSSSNEFKPKQEELPQVLLSRSETNNNFEYFEPELDGDSNFNLNEDLQLVTYAGILSRFRFWVKVQKKEHLDQSEHFFKELFITFCAVMNNLHSFHCTLSFRYYNPFEKNLQIILDEICKNELDEVPKGDSIKHKLLSLIANRLLVVRKPNGLSLLQKEAYLIRENSLATRYTQHLRDWFIIYQQNKVTNFSKRTPLAQIDYTVRRNKENALELRLDQQGGESKEKKQQWSGFQSILNYYLPKLIRRMTDDLKQEKSSLSSVKRMKTERFYKDTILSFKSLIKSLNQSDINTRMNFDDQKSLTVVMPADFNAKISNFFEREDGVKETTIYEFYYCMKFILIQPSSRKEIQQEPLIAYDSEVDQFSPNRKRRSTIDKIMRQSQKQKPFITPKYLQDTLGNFYDMLQVQHVFLLGGVQAHIVMRCFKVKQVFKQTEEYFYKFEMQFKGQRIKMMKLIATSYDIYLLVTYRHSQIKSSRKKEKQHKEEYFELPAFNRLALLSLLKEISQRIFVKKDYIYSIMGIQTSSAHFNYINKFRLQGKTVQNKKFMITHLKCIHVLLQKSIKIISEHLREYAVLTIRHVQRSRDFNVIFYIPAHQRTYSITLNTTIVDYLKPEHKAVLFENETPLTNQDALKVMFDYEEATQGLKRRIWNNFSRLLRFQVQSYEQRTHMLVRIGTYVAFLKDCCFSQFFDLREKKVLHLEMSLSRKPQHPTSEFQIKNLRNFHPKRKSASSKELLKRNNFLVGKEKDMKSSTHPYKPNAAAPKKNPHDQIFRKGEVFDRPSKIYQTETSKYIIYISLSKIYQIGEEGEEGSEGEAGQTRRVNFSFCLSDLIPLLKQSKKELYTRQEKIENEFNEEVFSFAILLRAMTIIKYRLIDQLKQFSDAQGMFVGEKTISLQKQFKNSLIRVFSAQNDTLYSLNASKKLHKLQNNIFLINKSLMGKRNVLVSLFYDQKGSRVKFYLTSPNELASKQKTYSLPDMKFPWIQHYQKQHLFRISSRLYKYYKNVLLYA